MDQYINSTKLFNCSNSNSANLFDEFESPQKPSSNISTYTLAIDSSDLYIQMPIVPEVDQSDKSTDVSIQTSSSLENNSEEDMNFSLKMPSNNSLIKQMIDSNISIDISSNELKSDGSQHFSTFRKNDIDNHISKYKLSDFFIKIEQIPHSYISDIMKERSKHNDYHDHDSLTKSKRRKTSSASYINQRLNIDSEKRNFMKRDTINMNNNSNSKSPQYQRRQSCIDSSKRQFSLENSDNNVSNNLRGTCRSPVLIRQPQSYMHNLMDGAFDVGPNIAPMQVNPMIALSLNRNDDTLSTTHNLRQIKNPSLSISHSATSSSPLPEATITSKPKRSFEYSQFEQILVKRRLSKVPETIITQRNYCKSYPLNIQRCVDCQKLNESSPSTRNASCRFQNCRILKCLGDDKYKTVGFTTADKIQGQQIEYLIEPNSGGQPSLSLENSKYVFQQLVKLFCLIYEYEKTERLVQSETNEIVSKRYIPGWREVCDECCTTLFNHHYICKQCGYMICIECSKDLFQSNIEKRRRSKRICTHNNSYCLSEFIPWKIFNELYETCFEYLSKIEIDKTIKFYEISRDDNLSIFVKTLKMKRLQEMSNIQTNWGPTDCNFDENIEFYCNGRLPVFNEWTSENAKSFFQKVWKASCPVLVKRVHNNLSKTLWQPNSFKLHMNDHHETPALWDCETLKPISTNENILAKFWDGFECLDVRLRNEEQGGRLRILKLKDWPTKRDFASVFPTRLHDLMDNIPFSDYTRRSYTYDGVTYSGGSFNIVERLPISLVKPDLGPKLYIAYSQLTSQASKKAGTTNLHIDVSDAVNVLVYVGVGGHGIDGSDKYEEIKLVENEILDSNIDDKQLQRLRNGEQPGALWHIFRSDDAQTIREYISRNQRKTHRSDSIHDQTAYLEKKDLENLRDQHNVESYPILQFLGDSVFIPSGAPHQVKNLHSCIKIAEDFVSPENLDRCLITTNEFRSLSKTHTNHADILQAKNILYYTMRDALNSIMQLD